jgi:hypothetical protein
MEKVEVASVGRREGSGKARWRRWRGEVERTGRQGGGGGFGAGWRRRGRLVNCRAVLRATWGEQRHVSL